MKYSFLLLTSVFLFFSCGESTTQKGSLVKDITELHTALKNASPGTEIVMANGAWNDVEIKFVGYGEENKPITLRAETAGEVKITGKSDLKLGGEYLVVDGLHFAKGASPSRAVIEFAINNDTLANHSIIKNCVIEDFNKAQRNKSAH